MKTKPCPICDNNLALPDQYLDAIKKLREHTEKYRDAIIKDYELNNQSEYISKLRDQIDFLKNQNLDQAKSLSKTMKILKELNKLHDKWIYMADSQMSDKYNDGVYDCINQLADVILKHLSGGATEAALVITIYY